MLLYFSSFLADKIKNRFTVLLKFSLCFILSFILLSETHAQQSTVDPSKNRADTTKKPIPQNKKNNPPVSAEVDNLADAEGFTNGADTLTSLERKVFGYTIFHNANVSFTPNLNMATPKTYVVGPADVLLLQVYGVAQNRYTLTVTPEGTVNIPDIGLARVAGFSLQAVKAILLDKLAIRYSGISGSSPNTFLEVTLGNIRTIKVNMVGEIFKPGTYSLPSYINVFNALFAAGGPTTKGTFRFVQVYRANKLVAEVDVYDFLVNGKINNNIRLEDDDVILIRPAANRVEVTGEVKTPGIFEFKSKESFADILKFSGGFTDIAYKEMVSITQKGLTEKQVLDLSSSQYGKANLNDGDSISVGIIQDRFSNRVQISGAVNRPGPFAVSKGMTVEDLIQKGGGLKGDAFLKRAILYRTKPDFTQEAISIDLTYTNGHMGVGGKFELMREDVLSIANLYDIQEEYYVNIKGEVNNNGAFPYADSMTIGDLILKAGGFKYTASGSFIEIVRRVSDPGKVAEIITVSIDKDLRISEANNKIALRPFDQVFVRAVAGFEAPKSVSIEGEVMYKGTFAIERKEMRISDLLKRAGGLTNYAYVKGATLVRRTKKYSAPTLAEQENADLILLRANLKKDDLLASTESNKELIKRIDKKIIQNLETVNKERAVKEKELLKQSIVNENTSSLASNSSSSLEEKDQELVAINLDEIIKSPGSNFDLVLKDGDILNVPEKLETVSVKGGVLFPVSVRFDATKNFNDYISRAGGYNARAIKNKCYVLQANGRVETVKTFLFFKSYPKVEPGAEIFVPALAQDKLPFNYANSLAIITGLITSTLTLIILLRTL